MKTLKTNQLTINNSENNQFTHNLNTNDDHDTENLSLIIDVLNGKPS